MAEQSKLFTPIKLRKLELKNRIAVSPMCQYSALDGVPSSWHMVHLGSRAVGGAGLVMVEASAVAPNGRISPSDTGIWNEKQATAFKPIVDFMEFHGAAPGIQLAHAGRKAGTAEPWNGGGPIKESWDVIAPSPKSFKDGYAVPREITVSEMDQIVADFTAAASHARHAGFKVVEVHMAHGYLLHEFLSPLTNLRTDQFGGSFENRIRLPLAVARAVRDIWPEDLPVFVRVSASDWINGGWDIEQTVLFGIELKKVGVDVIDVSSGGLTADAVIPASPGFQVPFARLIKSRAGLATAAVGLITDAHQAEEILIRGDADIIMIGREFLRDPYFPMKAAKELGSDIAWPKQYVRAKQ